MKGNVINLNTLHLNSVRLNGIGKVQSVSLKGGSTEDPVFPPVEPPIEPEPTPTYTLSASVANGMVSATLNGVVVSLPYTANEGDTIVLSVTPNDGYAFEGWADGNTDNPRTITMTADVALSAQCAEVVQPPVGNYIQFEDKAVEAICVANWSSDGIGLTEEDAAKVTDIGIIFSGNNEITSFEEFRYFTGVQKIGHKENETYGAFKGCTNLRSIALPDSCYSIGYEAFGDCKSLTSIAYGNVTEIGSRAFRNCTSLGGELSFPYLTTLKGDGAFANCSALANIDIPSAENIGPHTFYMCTSLGVVELLVVTGIGNAAFHSCTNLQSVLVRTSTPPTLGSNVFYGSTCPIYVPDASLEAYKTAVNWSAYADRIHPLSEIEGSPYIQFEDAEVERVLMSKGVSSDGVGITMEDAARITSIGSWFSCNNKIERFKELQYFVNVQTLDASAFRECTNLVDIDLRNIQQVNQLAFGSANLSEYDLDMPELINLSASGGLWAQSFYSSSLRSIKDLGKIESIPDGVYHNNVVYSNFGSSGVESVRINENMRYIGYGSFYNCQKLHELIIEEGLEDLGESSFGGCTSLGNVTLPKSIKTIRALAFVECPLQWAIVRAEQPPTLVNTNAFFITGGASYPIYVPDASLEAYKTATNWLNFASRIKGLSEYNG